MLESTPTGKTFRPWRIQDSSKIWLWFALMISPILAKAPECCPPGILWSGKSKNCTDGSEIKLSCPEGFYRTDPELGLSEAFEIYRKDNLSWLAFTYNQYGNEFEYVQDDLIHPDSYCLTKMNETEEPFALICFTKEVAAWSSTWRQYLFGIFSFISSSFLAITLFVYLILPELRDIQDKAMMSAIAPLTVAFILMGVQLVKQSPIDDDSTCVMIAIAMYFSYLCAFFWLNIVSFNVWRSVWFHNFKIKPDRLFAIYCAFGWGLPSCFLIAALTAHNIEGYHLSPGFGEISCWFNGQLATWVYFEGPILMLLVFNLIYLGLTCWKLWHEYRDFNGDRLKSLRFKCLLYVKLVLVMGITWIFEVLSFASGPLSQSYWIFTDLLNVFQGIIIFVILVATRKRVRKLLSKKRPFGIVFPKSWAACKDEECDIEILPEEVELSQSA